MQPTYSWTSVKLFKLLIEKRKPIIALTLLAAVTSMVISLLIVPRYKSVVTIFPVAAGSVSHNLLSDNIAYKNLLQFGGDDELDQMMQVLHSDDIRNLVIEKFDLMTHYEIDTNTKYPRTTLYRKFTENIKFKRTEFLSIDIEVLDRDPQTASDMANYITEVIDTVMNKMMRQRALKAYKIVEREYLYYAKQMNIIEDSLAKIRKMGINNYNAQAEVFNDAYATAIAQGKTQGIKMLEEKMKILSQYGSSYNSLSEQLSYMIGRLTMLKNKYMEAKIDLDNDLPYKFVVSKAVKAEKKAYPIRWLIVLASTAGAFLLTILILLILDNLKSGERSDS